MGTLFLEYLILSINVAIILFLVLMNGFFVASEFSIVKIRPSRLETLIKEGNERAKNAKIVTEHLDAYLSVTQLGITIASLGIGWIGEPTVIGIFRPIFDMVNLPSQVEHTVAFLLGFSIITALHIIMGELVPKSLSIQKTEQIVLFVAGPLIFFDKLFYPAVWFMNHVANGILKCMGVEAASEAEEAHDEDEIRLLMEESHKHGYIDKTELTYLDNVFSFNDRHAGEVMVPRIDMICLYVNKTFEENLQIILREKETRYPLCDGDKDHIIGFVHVMDILKAYHDGKNVDLRRLAREMPVAPATFPVNKVLRMLQKRRTQMALLLDEYGGTAGMITVEDILEEIVGEIQDEFDEERKEVEEKGNKCYSLDAMMILEQVNDTFELDLDTEYCDTIGGWVYSRIDFPPKVGQQVEVEGAIFTVEELDKRRIIRVGLELVHVPENLHEDLVEENLENVH